MQRARARARVVLKSTHNLAGQGILAIKEPYTGHLKGIVKLSHKEYSSLFKACYMVSTIWRLKHDEVVWPNARIYIRGHHRRVYGKTCKGYVVGLKDQLPHFIGGAASAVGEFFKLVEEGV